MKREKSAMLMAAACGLLLALCAVSLCVGSFPLSLSQIGEILQGGLAGEMPARVFWTLRVPRTCLLYTSTKEKGCPARNLRGRAAFFLQGITCIRPR